MEFRIRAATGKDAEAIALLSRELGYPAEPKAVREGLRRNLARDDRRVVVVRSNAKGVESHAFHPSLSYLPSKTQAVYRKRANS